MDDTLLPDGQDGSPAGVGTVTPGNASPMTDGAAALVLASRARAQQLGLPVLAVIRGHADANQAPEWWVKCPETFWGRMHPSYYPYSIDSITSGISGSPQLRHWLFPR